MSGVNQTSIKFTTVTMVMKKLYKIQDIALRVMKFGVLPVKGHADLPAENEESRPRRFGDSPPPPSRQVATSSASASGLTCDICPSLISDVRHPVALHLLTSL